MKHNLFEKCRNVEKKNCHPKIILPSFLKISCTKIFRREGEEVAMFFPRMLCNHHKVPRWLPVM